MGAAIAGIGSVIPEVVITNHDLEKNMDTTDAWIQEKIGIKERRIARPDQAMSDLAIAAGRQAVADADMDPEAIEMVIVAGSNHDYLMPNTSCIVQDKIGAPNAGALDLRNACSGFIYALGVGASMIQAGVLRNALVIGAEIHSRIIDWTERTVAVFFGDGAGAVMLKRCRPEVGVLSSFYGADGANADAIITPAGGSRQPLTAELVEQKAHLCRQDGKRVKGFVQHVFEHSVRQALDRAGHSVQDLSFLISHQANLRLIEEGMGKLGLPMSKTHTIIEWAGNSGSASVPTCLHDALKHGKIKAGDLLALTGFGAGLAYGANVVRWAGAGDFID